MTRRLTAKQIEAERYTGDEPALLGPKFTPAMLTRAFNWYNTFYDAKDARDWLIHWMIESSWPTEEIAAFNRVPNAYVYMTPCTLARLIMHKCDVGADARAWLENHIRYLIFKYANAPRPNPQVWLNKPVDTGQIIADMEDEVDRYWLSGYKERPDVFQWLTQRQPKQVEVQALAAFYDNIYTLLTDTVNPLPDEFWDHCTKKQKKEYLQFLADIVLDSAKFLKNTSQAKRVSKPRKKKAKPASKVVAKMQFLPQFPELKIVSIDPSLIVGAGALWTYNTTTRKLTYFRALDGGFSVKGTTITNFDPDQSYYKTLRKPAETLDQMLNTGRATMRDLFSKLSTKPQAATVGRINKDTILLKAFK